MNIRPFPLGRGQYLEPDGTPAVMGILNVTPDSFSDGGDLPNVDAAVAAARDMHRHGARLLDVGGESTRPGAEETALDEELRRVVPVVEALVTRVGLPVSVDTRKAAVFRECWEVGASLLNDTSALAHDPEMGATIAATDAAAILMHMRGTPATMTSHSRYDDLIGEVRGELSAAVDRALAAGIPRERLALDPGIGFAKDSGQNVALLRRLDELRLDGFPLLVGPSRKRFLGEVTGRSEPRERDVATAVVVAHLARAGVEVVRVHAVDAAVDAIAVGAALGGREPMEGGAAWTA